MRDLGWSARETLAGVPAQDRSWSPPRIPPSPDGADTTANESAQPSPSARPPGPSVHPPMVRSLPGWDHPFSLVLDVPSQLSTTSPEARPGQYCQGWLVGEIDYYATGCLEETRDRIGSTGARVGLDLSGVTFLDAAGIGLLVALRNQLMSAGGDLSVQNVTPQTGRILEITGVAGHLLVPGGRSPWRDYHLRDYQ